MSAPLPLVESLSDTIKRVMPYYKESILPLITYGKNVLIAAHGNSLRALMMYLDNMTEEAILELDIPTGIPIIYELNDYMVPTSHYYLGGKALISEKLIK